MESFGRATYTQTHLSTVTSISSCSSDDDNPRERTLGLYGVIVSSASSDLLCRRSDTAMRLCSVQRDRCQSVFWLRPAASRHRGSSMIAWRFVPTRRLIYPGDDSRVVRPSGVARNFRQGVRQSVAFLSVHPRSAALPSRPYTIKKTSWHIIPAEWLNEQW